MDEKVVGPRPSLGGAFAFVRAVRRWRTRDWVVYNSLLLVAAVVVYLHLTSPPPAVSPEASDRIAVGMTWEEVHAVVGAHPGGYGCFLGPGTELSAGAGPLARTDRWGSPHGLLNVGYDATGRVCRKR